MSHYVLIHGAWEDSRAWDDVSAVLKQAGHAVTAIDLPGSGRNTLEIPQVTMARYVEHVVEVIDQIDQPVILVAHSMAGATTSQVAEQAPEKIERLVYVASFLLKDGGSVLEAMQSDEGGQLLPEIVFSEDQTYATVPEQVFRRVGFHDVEEANIPRYFSLMAEKHATEPFMAKVALTDENFGSVLKTYIRTTIDRITSSDLQDRLIANWDVDAVLDLEAGHFPAFAVPEKLAALLLEANHTKVTKAA